MFNVPITPTCHLDEMKYLNPFLLIVGSDDDPLSSCIDRMQLCRLSLDNAAGSFYNGHVRDTVCLKVKLHHSTHASL